MEARKIAVKLRRDPRETAERHSQANPLTLECTLASGETVTETMDLRAELHAAQTPATTPLATTATVVMASGSTGPWELEFSGAQMNQTVLPDSAEDFWLVVYATNAADDLFTLGKIALTLTFDNVSQTTPPPPEPPLYATYAFRTIAVAGQSSVVAETTQDTLTLVAGTNVTLTTNAATDTITISATGGGGGGGGDVTGPASSTDNAITRFDGTTGKLLQNSSATLSDVGGIAADTLAISTAPTGAGGTGIFRYDTGEKVPEVGIDGITLKIGVQEYVRVYNDTASTMAKGAVVYISGAQGNRVAVKLADATDESTSAGTIGIVSQSITAGAEGFVQVSGPMYNLNTIGLTAGALLFLSETAGEWTQTDPPPPAHGVRLAYVERVSATVGSIYIKVDNGYELGELHNVSDGVTGATAFLVKNSATNVWESKNASDSRTAMGAGTGNGTVTTVSVTTANGVSGSVANATTTPAITFTLGAITPTTVNGITLSGSATPTLAVTGTTAVSGTNTGNVTLATSVSSVLALSGQQLQAVTDPGADRIVFFDQSANAGAGAWGYLVAGTGLNITGTTITATFSAASPGAIGGTTPSTGVFTQLDVRTELDVQSATGAAGPILSWNTGTDTPTNWERARLQWSSNVFVIGTAANGTGVNREVEIQPGGTTAARFTADGRVAIGTTSTASAATSLTVGTASSALSSTVAPSGLPSGVVVSRAGPFAFAAESTLTSGAGGGAICGLYSNDGAAMASGDRLGGFLIGGSVNSTTLVNACVVLGYASENWALGTNTGAALDFATTANGSVSRTSKMWINGDGNVGIGAGVFSTSVAPTARLQIRGAGTGTGVALLVENSSGTARFTVRDDGAFAFAGGTVAAAETGWTTFTNLTTDRTCDANSTTVEELADILGTLIVALKNKGIIAN